MASNEDVKWESTTDTKWTNTSDTFWVALVAEVINRATGGMFSRLRRRRRRG